MLRARHDGQSTLSLALLATASSRGCRKARSTGGGEQARRRVLEGIRREQFRVHSLGEIFWEQNCSQGM
jgi:hypothetical protein